MCRLVLGKQLVQNCGFQGMPLRLLGEVPFKSSMVSGTQEGNWNSEQSNRSEEQKQ